MIWIVGNKGMLGTELSLAFASHGAEYIGSDRNVDILDPRALSDYAQGKNIEGIVNCAAYTAVDKAEDEPELCGRLNVEGPANLAALAERLGAFIIHLSTDYVFSGEGRTAYAEDAAVDPRSVYGRTKAEGERAVRELCSRSLILRTAWLYGEHGPNFVHTMLRLMRERAHIGVVADQFGSPTWAADLARAMLAIVQKGERAYGTFHYTNAGICSWHEFAIEIHRLGRGLGLLDRDCEIKALATSEYPTKARRPAYSVLSKDRIREAYGVEPPDWRMSLEVYLRGLCARTEMTGAGGANA